MEDTQTNNSKNVLKNKENGDFFKNDNNVMIGNQSSDFEEAFEQTGHGRFNIGLLFACGLCLVGVIMESLGAGFILQAAQCEFDLSQSGKALLSSAIFIGIVCSSHMWGYLADTRGRRGIMMPGALLATLCSLLSSLAPVAWIFITLRIMTGFFVSSTSACIYAYIGELHINSRRTRAIARASFFVSLALVILPAMAWLILDRNWELPIPFLGIKYSPWRLYITICSLPNFLFFLTLLRYPESPKFLFVNGKVDAALNVLKKIYSINFQKSIDDFAVKEIKHVVPTDDNDDGVLTSMWKQTIPLFKMPLLPCTAMACFNQFTVFFLSSSFYLWFPVMLNNLQSRTSDAAATICVIMNGKFNIPIADDEAMLNMTAIIEDTTCQIHVSTLVFQIGMGMGAIFAGCYMIIGIFIDKIGKKILLVLILGIPGCCTLGLYWAANSYLIVVLLVVLLCSGSAGGVVTAVAVDLFPTKLRGMAMCLSLMCGRIGAVVGANLAGIMLEKSCENTFLVFGIEVLVCVASTVLWPKPEAVKEKLNKKGIPFS